MDELCVFMEEQGTDRYVTSTCIALVAGTSNFHRLMLGRFSMRRHDTWARPKRPACCVLAGDASQRRRRTRGGAGWWSGTASWEMIGGPR